ncbi:hypothetical protein [Streptomyces sp. DT2A-34]|uniref:hypothetical protein n=1 Tax=Streptomyces sp. DT2A-34 TaxID=3051182 RepID=UPI00346407AB
MEHRAAKAHGRAHWYERYSLHIARVEHSSGFERASTLTAGSCELLSPDGVQR